MNLYKVIGYYTLTGDLCHTIFILAKDKPKAINKYLEVDKDQYCHRIRVEFICKRDSMIPTTED